MSRKLGIGTLGMALALPLGAGALHATAHAPATTEKVSAHLAKGTTMDLAGTIDGIPITVKCSVFTASGSAPTTGMIKVTLPSPPKISSCTDSLGASDTVTTNQTKGKWKLTEVKSGSTISLELTMPEGGATFSSSLVSGCVVTAAPTAAATISGAFKKTGTLKGVDTVEDAPIPVSATGCSASSPSTISATVDLAPVKA